MGQKMFFGFRGVNGSAAAAVGEMPDHLASADDCTPKSVTQIAHACHAIALPLGSTWSTTAPPGSSGDMAALDRHNWRWRSSLICLGTMQPSTITRISNAG